MPDNKVDSFVIYRYKNWNTKDNKPQYEEMAKIKNTGNVSYYRFVPVDELNKVIFYAVEVIPKDKVANKPSSSNLTSVPWANAPSNVLLTYSVDRCNGLLILKWNKYRGWDNVSKIYYRIEYQENNNPSKILSIQGSDYLVDDTTLTLPSTAVANFSFNNNSLYKFRVTALNFAEGYTCISNVIEYKPNIPKISSYINADGTRVLSKNLLEITFSLDSVNAMKKLLLYRSEFDSHGFEPIDTVPITGSIVTCTDSVADLDSKHYYYKATLLNPCNQPINGLESNIATNLILTLTPATSSNNLNLLSWDFYRYFRGDVKEYVIYRSRNNQTSQVGSTSDNKMTDNIMEINNKQVLEEICYQVEAIEENNPYGINGHVWSNTKCVTIKAEVEMPKYLLLGDNCKSKAQVPYMFPTNIFQPSKFLMIIYDRWGTKVFETNNPSEGWDGTTNGKIATQGGYMYYIKFSGSDNVTKEQRGSFVVICSQKE
jgi:gliding motility-associated-like protein